MRASVFTTSLFVLMSFLVLLGTSGCKEQSPAPIAPANGITISNNMPNLVWNAVDCDHYIVVIDDIIEVAIPSDRNFHTAFNLSFGQHSWQVAAIKDNDTITGVAATFSINDVPLEQLPESAKLLRDNWKVKSSLLVNANGEQITTSSINTNDWYSTSLPATPLTVLVRNGIYPNPHISLNNLKIPDTNDEFNIENDLLKYSHIEGKNPWTSKFWYYKEFSVEAEELSKMSWLNLNEINYRAEVWLNGQLIADSSQLVGMERKFKIPTTGILQNQNKLAIAIYPPDHIGKPAPPPVEPLAHPGRNMGADGMIAKDYTKWDVLGWDWQPGVRDRDMGITEDVYLLFTDEVEISDLYVSSNLDLPDTSKADITISATIVNHSDEKQEGTLTAQLTNNEQSIKIEQSFSIEARQAIDIILDKNQYKQLLLEQPKLWWPHGYGEQNTYNVRLAFDTQSGQTALSETSFGIREVETYIGNNERVYKINGEKIYMKGGNWVIDMMLNWSASRYDHEIRLTKASGLNLLRVWGPTGAPPQAFYDAADKYGVLIWQDFLNDYWGTFNNNSEYTPTVELFRTNTIAMVKKYRNHPSLVIWCGGNEGPNPKEALIMNDILPKYDGRDSRHYLKISDNDGLHGGGPYHTLAPQEYFTHERMHGFSSELGPSGVPELESMKKFMLNTGKSWAPGKFPINSEWTYHDATDRTGSDMRKYTHFHNLVVNFYDAPDTTSINGFDEYIAKSQLVNYDAYRSCIEAINAQLWENSSGFALWKTNSSWPSVLWQVYDWYLQAHSGFYATKKANQPIHLQLNRETMAVDVINSSRKQVEKATISATLLDSDLNRIWQKNYKSTIAKNSVTRTGWTIPKNDEINYLVLKIEDQKGNIISENFYWLQKNNQFAGLNMLPSANVNVRSVKINSNELYNTYEVTISNNGEHLAFMTSLKLVGEKSGVELLPSYWSDNYLTLLPQQSKTISVNIDKVDMTEMPVVAVKAFNQDEVQIIPISQPSPKF
ncbi:MAG: hypothetical protein PF436_13805 [Prolixibacteraceae bacterium]|jgi:hypothetical protein|nr:hypothetical protein [Prolixibacteraceae bacterium]